MLARSPRRLFAAALIAAVALAGAACGGEPQQSALEREVQEYLRGVVAPAELSDIDCPDDAPVTRGSIFRCDGIVDGSFYEAEITIVDAQGRKEIRPQHAVLRVLATETELAASAANMLGFAVTADCGYSDYLVVAVNQNFLCTLNRETDDSTQDIEVTVLNEAGTIDWSLRF